jgi:hypothetical protein
MGHIEVAEASPETPAGDLPADVQTIRAAAEQARAMLTAGPLPRYGEVTAACAELSGMLRVLVDDLDKRAPEAYRVTLKSLIAEVDHRLNLPLGPGLQSAVDHVASLASIAVTLCRIHAEVIGG